MRWRLRRDEVFDVVMQLAALLGMIGLCWLLTGCSGGRCTGPAPVPAPGPDLVSMGRLFLWAGGISLVVGIFGRVVLAVASANPLVRIVSGVPGVSGIPTLLAEFGAVALVSGICFMWLGAHLWVLVASLVAVALGYAWHRRRTIRRWLVAWQTRHI